MSNSKTKNLTLSVAIIAMYSALIIGGKNALAIVPNVEVVSLLLAVCAFSFGFGYSLPVAVIFMAEQLLQYGFNTWLFGYIIHWPCVAVVFSLLGKLKYKNMAVKIVVSVGAIAVLTALFGVLTSAVDTLIGYVGGNLVFAPQSFFSRFVLVYGSGVAFYLIHIASNCVLFAVAFVPLVKVNEKAKLRLFAQQEPNANNE